MPTRAALQADRPLTPRQRVQLEDLLAAGAVDRESAKGQFDDGMQDLSPLVLGALRDHGLAGSRVVRPRDAGRCRRRPRARRAAPPRRSVR